MGYVYKSTQKRTFLYRKAGGTHYVSVPMRDWLTETYVRSTLRQAGRSDEDVKGFLDEDETSP